MKYETTLDLERKLEDAINDIAVEAALAAEKVLEAYGVKFRSNALTGSRRRVLIDRLADEIAVSLQLEAS